MRTTLDDVHKKCGSPKRLELICGTEVDVIIKTSPTEEITGRFLSLYSIKEVLEREGVEYTGPFIFVNGEKQDVLHLLSEIKSKEKPIEIKAYEEDNSAAEPELNEYNIEIYGWLDSVEDSYSEEAANKSD
ncbi:hypothetical protein COEREDRAFT_86313 [Coemansia reversa NRRL 1564]|uniref:Uncharacterized protein n=1 Tax=Coemansia reversa (strain ATCC 12441 / NRRL 1564) TaxID=763665 RepID=A0A2G5BE97_COERN|nr:hypothetical protein COEREDRAFT_86313 [Coemansia reversa NRRL 1564]|eukprot:PIA17321.1 hypothetical protein COEREDRAFT_86313 [Coemansia reversa NRRL 1564]